MNLNKKQIKGILLYGFNEKQLHRIINKISVKCIKEFIGSPLHISAKRRIEFDEDSPQKRLKKTLKLFDLLTPTTFLELIAPNLTFILLNLLGRTSKSIRSAIIDHTKEYRNKLKDIFKKEGDTFNELLEVFYDENFRFIFTNMELVKDTMKPLFKDDTMKELMKNKRDTLNLFVSRINVFYLLNLNVPFLNKNLVTSNISSKTKDLSRIFILNGLSEFDEPSSLEINGLIYNKALKDRFAVPKQLIQLESFKIFKSPTIKTLDIPEELVNLKEIEIMNMLQFYTLNLNSELINLESIEIYEADITELIIPKELKNIKSINIKHNHNGLEVVKIPDQLNKLQKLALVNQELMEFNMSDKWFNLTELNLSFNNLKFIKLPKSLINMKTLTLTGNPDLSSLDIPEEYINLKYCNLTACGLKKFQISKKLIKMEDLNLKNNELSEFNVPKELTKLKSLNLNGNFITTLTIPKELINLQYLGVMKMKTVTKFKTPKELMDNIKLN